MSMIQVTIPKIVLSIDTDDMEKEERPLIEKIDTKEKDDDFFFVVPHNSMQDEKIHVLTIVYNLTVPVFSFYEISKSNLVEAELYGFDNVIPHNQITFGDKEFANVKDRIETDKHKILNDITMFSIAKFSTRLSAFTQIDVVSLNRECVVWSYDLTHDCEIHKDTSKNYVPTTTTKCCSRCGNEHNLLDMFIAVGEDASDASLVVCKECSNMYSSKILVKNALVALN